MLPPVPLLLVIAFATHVPLMHASGNGQSPSSRHAAHACSPFVVAQNGVTPPQGEQVGPQNVAVSQGAQSAASLQ